MMIHFNQEKLGCLHETPTKKIKEISEVEPKTAESHDQFQNNIEDIQPEELFAHFNDKVKVIEQQAINQEELEIEVQKKLTYQYPKPKVNLFMSPAWSSMKKKSKIGYETSHDKFQSIVLFEVTGEEGESGVSLEKIDLSHLSQEQCHTPRRKGEKKELEDWSTPKKVVPSNQCI